MLSSPLIETYSVLLNEQTAEVSDDRRRDILLDEARWHYSQHFFAESKGEEVIEDLLHSATEKKQRALLGAQLRDEQEHAKLFRSVIGTLGLDERADGYAHGYSNLVKQQKSLAEKVYVFQIITEAASAAYCEWRIQAMRNDEFGRIDREVERDERRHLAMGQSMLMICDPDEIAVSLTPERRTEIIRAMNELCRSVTQSAMTKAILSPDENPGPSPRSLLDRMVARSVLKEARQIDEMLSRRAQ